MKKGCCKKSKGNDEEGQGACERVSVSQGPVREAQGIGGREGGREGGQRGGSFCCKRCAGGTVGVRWRKQGAVLQGGKWPTEDRGHEGGRSGGDRHHGWSRERKRRGGKARAA